MLLNCSLNRYEKDCSWLICHLRMYLYRIENIFRAGSLFCLFKSHVSKLSCPWSECDCLSIKTDSQFIAGFFVAEVAIVCQFEQESRFGLDNIVLVHVLYIILKRKAVLFFFFFQFLNCHNVFFITKDLADILTPPHIMHHFTRKTPRYKVPFIHCYADLFQWVRICFLSTKRGSETRLNPQRGGHLFY